MNEANLKSYLFTIFSRVFLALSGFLVFLLTSYLYGPEGRGILGYATSIFATLGIALSFNLGRSFVAETVQNDLKKKELLGKFLTLNFILGCIAAAIGLVYLLYSETGKSMLTPTQAYLFAMTSLFFIWSANGNYFFSTFFKTNLQDLSILGVRLFLIITLGIIVVLNDKNFDHFVLIYCVILTAGVLIENLILLHNVKATLIHKPDILALWKIIKKSFFHHVDYLAFHTVPFLLTIISASFLTKGDIGKVNFTFQVLNIVFLFSVTANIKITALVSHSGYKANLKQFKKLVYFTLGISVVSSVCLYLGLEYTIAQGWLTQFEGAQKLFLLSTLSVPGFFIYYILSPIWIELKKQKTTAILHSLNFIVCLLSAYFLIREYQMNGVMYAYGVFSAGVVLIQFFLSIQYLGILKEKR